MSEIITFEQWTDALDRATNGYADPAAGGWKTAIQWATEWGKARRHTARLIEDLIAAGLWEKAIFRIRTARGRYPTPHYRPKPSSKTPAKATRKWT